MLGTVCSVMLKAWVLCFDALYSRFSSRTVLSSGFEKNGASNPPSFSHVTWMQVPGTGNTGLHLAAYCGRVECLRYLVSQGGDAAKRNRHGQTPAMLAVLTGQTEVLRWLLDSTKNTTGDLGCLFTEVCGLTLVGVRAFSSTWMHLETFI